MSNKTVNISYKGHDFCYRRNSKGTHFIISNGSISIVDDSLIRGVKRFKIILEDVRNPRLP